MAKIPTDKEHAPLVYVEWVDAATVTARWQDRKEAIKAGTYYSGKPIVACGFLLAERKDVLVLGLTYNSHNDDVGHVMSIPTRAIKSITPLRGVKGSRKPKSIA